MSTDSDTPFYFKFFSCATIEGFLDTDFEPTISYFVAIPWWIYEVV